MFTSILEILTEKGGGIHAYGAVVADAYKKAAETPDMAAAYYILATAAERFVDEHERMPISTQALEQSYAGFRADIETLQAAYETGDAGQILLALNAIAAKRTPR